MLARLVSFDTTSRNSNLELIGFVGEWLGRNDVPFRVSHDLHGRKANIHAVIGPRISGGIALSGHVDTVPVDGQAWSRDPFTLHAADDRLYARGACDMKGFVASCLAAVPSLQARHAAGLLARPIHLFITYDEETSMAGARRLIADIAESGLRPAMCVVGEPSLMQPILAHKGRLSVQGVVRGRTGHSSQPALGVNAVQAAAEAIAWVSREARRLAAEGPFAPGFDPPHTTVHVGTVNGGTILNIIPERCTFVMEWRAVPGHDPLAELARLRRFVAAHIEPEMHAVDPASGFSLEVDDDIPGMGLPDTHELATLIKQVTGSNSTGRVSYGTEGGLFERAGIPSIVCGPGSILQAHQADEWIARSELDSCDRFIQRLADRLAP